jgi:hypothetical protein
MAFRHRSRAAAEREAARVGRDLPFAEVSVDPDNSVRVRVTEARLTPSQRERIAACHVAPPAPPSPESPVLPTFRDTREVRERSTIENPTEKAYEIFEKHYRAGDIDNRKDILDECVAAGIAFNTAKTLYPKFRASKGLPSSVRVARAKARGAAVSLSSRRPSAVKVQNGIAEPAPGTYAREVWAMADTLLRKTGRVPKRGEVALRLPHVHHETMKTAFPRWRRFHALPSAGQHHQRRT